jgi:gliding motility-associated-like protein
MKHFYWLFITALCLWAFQADAQLANPPIYIETIVHHSDYGEADHNLAGFVTYKVYVQFANSDCYLTSIFAQEAAQDCIQDPVDDAFFTFDCGVFQHEFGTELGFTQLCGFIPIYPTLAYDSYLTIGQTCSENPGCDILNYVGLCPQWLTDFEQLGTPNLYDGGSFFWDENAIFGATCSQNYPDSPTNADDNNRVLIGQFTTCGNMNGCFNIQYVDANGNTGLIASDLCFTAVHPCLDQPMSNVPTFTSPCFDGEFATLELNSGGNGTVDYTLYSIIGQEISSYSDPAGILEILDLDEGDYYIVMEDEAGCRDTTADFNVTFPDPFEFTATITQDELCFGQNAGVITFNCSGGTGNVAIQDAAGVNYSCNQTADGLTCGTYVYTAEDENSCVVTKTVNIACPAQIAFNPSTTNIDCFGDDDGAIFGTAFGGSGDITASLVWNGDPLTEAIGLAPFDINFSGLDEGQYTLTLTDTNFCSLSVDLEITEPDEFLYEFFVTDASCFGFCDGILDTATTGGAVPIVFTAINEFGNPTPLNALCAGMYDIVMEYGATNCLVSDNILVGEPSEITYNTDTTSVTCFGSCDGAIQLLDVNGSAEGFTYEISPNTNTCVAPCSGANVTFSDLCSGPYTITITSANGCTQTADAFVETPDAMEFEYLVENVSCFEAGDGLINVFNVTGGSEPYVISLTDLDFVDFDSVYTYEDLEPGNYFITVQDINECTAINYFDITEPELLTITIDTTIACSCGGVCDGILQYTPAGGTPNYQYLLKPDSILGPGFGIINGLCAGDYEVFLIDVNNCIDSAEFTIIEPDPLTIEILLDAPTCTGMNDGSAEITVGGGTGELSLFIDPDTYETEPIDSVTYGLSQLAEDTLYLELSDANGCRIMDTLGIVPDIITDMILTMTSTPESCWNELDGTATVAVQNGNPPFSYEWDDNLFQTTATAMGLSPNADYVVRVTDDIGCNLTASVFVEANIGCFFIATAITPNGDGVNDSWILGGFEYYPECKINVFNRWGQTVFSSIGYSGQWDGRFNGQLLPIADYYFTIDYAEDKEVIMGTVTIKY